MEKNKYTATKQEVAEGTLVSDEGGLRVTRLKDGNFFYEIDLPEEQVNALKDAASARGISVSQLFQEIIIKGVKA